MASMVFTCIKSLIYFNWQGRWFSHMVSYVGPNLDIARGTRYPDGHAVSRPD